MEHVMDTNVVFVPIPAEMYNELVIRCGHPTVDVSGYIEHAVSTYLDRTKDDEWSAQYNSIREIDRALENLGTEFGDPNKGYQWLTVFLPNDYYAEVAHEQIMYEGEAFSPSSLANRIASGTSRNAWRDFWIKKPRDKEWLLADDVRRNRA
jgi:hypothetical protein